MEFAHPHFLKGQEHLLEQIKRKVSVAARGPCQGIDPLIKTEKVLLHLDKQKEMNYWKCR